LGLALTLTPALLLAPLPAAAKGADWQAAVSQLQAEDARLQSLGWKLARANAPFCAVQQASIGLLLTDMRNFTKPEPIRKALGLRGDIAVEAAAEGSPAQAAGLRAGDEVLGIDGALMAQLPKVRAGDTARLIGLHDAVDAALSAKGNVAITVATTTGATIGAGRDHIPRSITIAALPVCRSRFELVDDANHAGADGKIVRIGRGILAENTGDAEAAALVAHELAHNILSHPARLAAAKRSIAAIRDTEREADRLSVWLIANAGYDPEAALRFMARWGARHDMGLLRHPDHDGWRDRAALMQAELAKVRGAIAAGASLPLDWRP